MSQEKMDIAKVLAILAQPQEPPAPLEHVTRLLLQIPYITKVGKVETRPVRIFMPEEAETPMPLIYVPHYEMGEDALELRDYLAKGWAVASPAEFSDSYNGKLTDDDLVFNNAALYTLRHRAEFDKDRICLVGGSAGGYMTLMLSGLQLGHCASIANGPITNVYFNFEYYFHKANALNQQALLKIMAEKAAKKEAGEDPAATDAKNQAESNAALELMKSLAELPIPFLAGLIGLFEPVGENFPDKEDMRRWEALSPVGIADCFCSPVMVNHCTSDVLVPSDQITRRFTYERPGDSLPDSYDARLPKDFPGKLGCSLEECLSAGETRTERFVVPEKADPIDLPYDRTKRFNINMFDDGPAEGYGTHSSRMDVGRRYDVGYLSDMFERTAAKTCILTPAMLRSLLQRYQGESIALPAHTGVDDAVYGSLAVYQKEVAEELSDWAKNHGEEALQEVFGKLLEMTGDAKEKRALQETMDEVCGKMCDEKGA